MVNGSDRFTGLYYGLQNQRIVSFAHYKPVQYKQEPVDFEI